MGTYPFCLAFVHRVAEQPESFPVDGDMGRRVHHKRTRRSNLWALPGVQA